MQFKQEGIVQSTAGCSAQVIIPRSHACNGCALKSACAAPGTQTVSAQVHQSSLPLEPGCRAVITVNGYTGFLAVTTAFIIPFIIFVSAIFTSLHKDLPEYISVLTGIAFLALYFFLLFLLRNRTAALFPVFARRSDPSE